MKRLVPVLFLMSLLPTVVEASQKSRCCKPANNCCESVRWYKAKDGTYREMLSYAKALSRSEDADDMEIALRGVRDELTASNVAAEAIKAEAADKQASLEAQIAELQKQLGESQGQIASQSERADKAEAAHKLAVETIAQLRDEAKRNEENLGTVRADLKAASAERDDFKSKNSDLEKQVADAHAEALAAEEARKKAEEELAKMKQEALESKKPDIQEEKKDGEASGGDGDEPKDDAPKAPESPTAEN